MKAAPDRTIRWSQERRRLVLLMVLGPAGVAAAYLASACAAIPAGAAARSQAATQNQAGPVYDGQWWLLRDGEEQTGFVSGYQDCYVSEYHGGGLFNKDIQSYVDDVNKYYLADATRATQSVSEALDAVRGGGSETPLPAYKAAKPPPEGQAVYDRQYWRDAGPSVRTGFVEGYLACHAAKLKDADAKFSKEPAEYVEGIEKAYLAEENSAGSQGEKPQTRIATMLHRLRDPETPPAKPASQPSGEKPKP